MLKLKLLGVPEISLDGRPVLMKRRGSISLLAYLALSQRAHAREVLASILCGDCPDDQARKFLSNLLVDLHRQVGGYVVSEHGRVHFAATQPHTVDVVDFSARSADCDSHSSLEDLEAAIALYAGEFLEGLSHPVATDIWAWEATQREELRNSYMQLLRAHMDACVERAAWERGIQSARRLLVMEPWQEETHRELIAMLARSGQRQAAIAQYLSCRRALHDEIGVEPSPETVALFNRVRGATVQPTHNLPKPMTPLVGRLNELARLSTWLADPECLVVTITGISGSGKTRLALHVARGFATPGSPPPEQPFADGIFLLDLAHEGPEGVSRMRADFCNRAVLLVLDDFDQAGTSAMLLPTLLAQAPGLKLLVTSRAPLGVPGERVVQLGGLCLPKNADDIETADASVLYVQEARRRSVGYQLPDRERLPLVQLCQMLCGFPLALVLAARWAVVLPCSALIDELQFGAGLDVLATTDGDLPERHRRVTGNLQHAVAGAVSPSNLYVYHGS
jgi:DNA-binding SARP family transcriptional activator